MHYQIDIAQGDVGTERVFDTSGYTFNEHDWGFNVEHYEQSRLIVDNSFAIFALLGYAR